MTTSQYIKKPDIRISWLSWGEIGLYRGYEKSFHTFLSAQEHYYYYYLEHGLDVLMVRSCGEIKLDMTGRLHEDFSRLTDGLQLHIPQDSLLLAVQGLGTTGSRLGLCLAILTTSLTRNATI